MKIKIEGTDDLYDDTHNRCICRLVNNEFVKIRYYQSNDFDKALESVINGTNSYWTKDVKIL